MNPLKDFDHIHADEALKEKTLQYVMTKKKRPVSKQMMLVSACALICLLAFSLFYFSSSSLTKKAKPQVAAFVSLDVNPSMELQVDKNFKVVKTLAFNKDAEAILQQVDVNGKTVKEALSLLVQNTAYSEYITNGFLEASVYAKNDTLTNEIYQMLESTLNDNLNTNQYHCAEIDEQQHASAKSHHISGGKYRLIELIQAFDATYDANELNKLNVRELYDILNRFDSTIVPKSCGGSQSEGHTQHNGHN